MRIPIFSMRNVVRDQSNVNRVIMVVIEKIQNHTIMAHFQDSFSSVNCL